MFCVDEVGRHALLVLSFALEVHMLGIAVRVADQLRSNRYQVGGEPVFRAAHVVDAVDDFVVAGVASDGERRFARKVRPQQRIAHHVRDRRFVARRRRQPGIDHLRAVRQRHTRQRHQFRDRARDLAWTDDRRTRRNLERADRQPARRQLQRCTVRNDKRCSRRIFRQRKRKRTLRHGYGLERHVADDRSRERTAAILRKLADGICQRLERRLRASRDGKAYVGAGAVHLYDSPWETRTARIRLEPDVTARHVESQVVCRTILDYESPRDEAAGRIETVGIEGTDRIETADLQLQVVLGGILRQLEGRRLGIVPPPPVNTCARVRTKRREGDCRFARRLGRCADFDGSTGEHALEKSAGRDAFTCHERTHGQGMA